MRRSTVLGASALALVVSACEPKPAPEAPPAAAPAPAEPAPPARRLEVTFPAEGDTVQGPSVTVHMAAFGFTIVPAGDTTANSGHLHVFLDRDVSPAGATIPAEPGFIVHMGNGADSLKIETVAPGAHRLIGVVGDAKHVPVEPPLVDTVNFVVK